MKPRIAISEKLQEFLTDYFDEDGNILVDFFCNGKTLSEIGIELTRDKRVILSKFQGMLGELLTIIEDIK
jgi:hypothetical protein